MPEAINQHRRHIVGAVAMTIVAGRLGVIGSAKAQPGKTTPADLPMMKRHPMRPVASRLPAAGVFSGASAWLNSQPLTAGALRGKAVLVNFCTYSCINWRRSLPYVRAWSAKYKDQGLVVIGVHTPEFGFEKDLGNVRRAVEDMQIEYPIAIDNDYAIWRAFNNEYWPALYFVDAQGNIRHHQFGEGSYDQSERIIQQMLAEAGISGGSQQLVSVDARGLEAAADWDNLQSPENYVGYMRTENFASPGGAAEDQPRVYVAPTRLSLNHWALAGNWTMGTQATALNKANGRIAYRFHARDLHIVMGPGPEKTPVRFRVLVDGQPPGAGHGLDVDAKGDGAVIDPRLYQLIRQPPPIADRQFEIEFLDPGVETFAFTFG